MELKKVIKRYPFLTILLVYGFAVGVLNYYLDQEFYLLANIPGEEISPYVYNNLLIPYWKNTMEPTHYELTNMVDLKTGEVIGQQKEPQYDFPIKKVKELYPPVSVLSWGILGLVVDLLRNSYKKSIFSTH